MDPLTRRSLLNKFINEKVEKQIQYLLQKTFDMPFVHPHPYVKLTKGNLPLLKPFDAIVFDPNFLITLLMTARWFGRVCMTQEHFVSNNNAHLLLYGNSGTGKSFILNILSSQIPTYRYLTTGNFQNPDILSSSVILLEEFPTRQLVTNHYKSLLDIKASIKLDFKNLHPENATEGIPCIISTNDSVLTTLQSLSS